MISQMNNSMMAELTQFLSLLTAYKGPDEWIEFRCYDDKKRHGKTTHRSFHSTPEAAAKQAFTGGTIGELKRKGSGFFFGILPRTDAGKRARKTPKEEIAPGAVCWVDIDLKDLEGGADDLAAIIADLKPTPSIIIRSGGGVHCYWLLDKNYPGRQIEAANISIMTLSQGDKRAYNLDRIIRLPYSWHCKQDPPVRVSVEVMTERRFSLESLCDWWAVPSGETGQVLPFTGGATVIPDDIKAIRPRPTFSPMVERLITNSPQLARWFKNEDHKGDASHNDADIINELLYRQVTVEDVADAISKKIAADGRKKGHRYIPLQINKEILRLAQRDPPVNVQRRPTSAPQATEAAPMAEQAAEPVECTPIPMVHLERSPDDYQDKRKRGRPVDSLLNCEALIQLAQLDRQFRYDSFTDQIVIPQVKKDVITGLPMVGGDGKAITENVMVHDSLITDLRLEIAREWQVEFGKEAVKDCFIYVARKHAFNPVQDYLYQCADDHQYTGIIETYLTDILGAVIPPEFAVLCINIGINWLVSAAARGLRPGCKADSALILKGPQSAGKTAFFRLLPPSERMFSNSRLEVKGGRDSYSALRGVWIWEFGELAGMRKSDVEPLKNWLTGQEDRYSKKYERFETFQPRHTIWCGSTNSPEFLRDLTGDRRFWPIEVGPVINTARLIATRDQLWADAVHLLNGTGGIKERRNWWLSKEEEEELARYQTPFKEEDTWTTMIRNHEHENKPNTAHQILRDVIGLTSAQQNRGAIQRLGAILASLKWQKGRYTVEIFDFETDRHGCKFRINEKKRQRNAWKPPVQL